jgi:urea transport system permease protein
MGLGLITKTLESLFFGAVWSKILVLLMVIVFIQFRPSGIFALKGRHADD